MCIKYNITYNRRSLNINEQSISIRYCTLYTVHCTDIILVSNLIAVNRNFKSKIMFRVLFYITNQF